MASQHPLYFLRRFRQLAVLSSALLICVAAPALAQATPSPSVSRYDERAARKVAEAHGFYAVVGLHQDDQGVWRGRAMQAAREHSFVIDMQGNFDSELVPPKPDVR